MRIAKSAVVITGASSGIGRQTALDLAKLGARLVLAARRKEALEQLAQECRRRGADCIAVGCDVTQPEQVESLARAAVLAFGGIDAWINDAGVYAMGKVDEMPLETFRRVMEVNYFGVVHGTRAALPHLRRAEHGVLINVSSALGRVAGPYLSAYAASKHAVRAFGEAVRDELRGSGVDVCTILPPAIDTPLFQHSANYTGRAIKPANPVYPASRVSKAIVSCLVAPRREVAIGVAKVFSAFHALFPALFERVMTRQMERDHFEDRPAQQGDGNLFAPMAGTTGTDGGWRERAKLHVPRRAARLLVALRAAAMLPRALLEARAG